MGDVITRVLLYDVGKIYVFSDITLAHRDGSKVSSSFTATSKTKSLGLTKMFFQIVDNVTEYLDHKYDLEALKAKKLVSAKTERIKILADGTLDKIVTKYIPAQ